MTTWPTAPCTICSRPTEMESDYEDGTCYQIHYERKSTMSDFWKAGTRVYWRGLGRGTPDRAGTITIYSKPGDLRACVQWDEPNRNNNRPGRNEPVWATRRWLAVIDEQV